MVELEMVSGPPLLIPPPIRPAEFPETVEKESEMGELVSTPPPWSPAVFPEMVELVIDQLVLPWLLMPPPLSPAILLEMVELETMALHEKAEAIAPPR